MKIWAHSIVKDEENFIWFAINSVLPFVDKILVWDTGSTDATVQIVREIQKMEPQKVILKEIGAVSSQEHTKARQEMLDETDADWIITLDGDEVWGEDSIKKLVDEISKNECESIVVRTINPVGDIYHYLPETAGQYQIAGKRGHLNLRAFSKKIPGLHLGGVYPREAYFDNENRPIQERDGVKFLDVSYLHLTHLARSSEEGVVAGNRKVRYEMGKAFPSDYYYPEVFFKERPAIIPTPWRKLSGFPYLLSFIETPFKKAKRMI